MNGRNVKAEPSQSAARTHVAAVAAVLLFLVAAAVGGSIKVAAPVYAASGDLLAQTAEVEIAEGGFHSFDINRDDIALAGEPRTGRLQVRVEVVVRAAPARGEAEGAEGGAKSRVGGGKDYLELIDNDSGKTTAALLLPAIQAAREAARR